VVVTNIGIVGGLGNVSNTTELEAKIVQAVRNNLPDAERSVSAVSVELLYNGREVVGAMVKVARSGMDAAASGNIQSVLSASGFESELATALAVDSLALAISHQLVQPPSVPLPSHPPPILPPSSAPPSPSLENALQGDSESSIISADGTALDSLWWLWLLVAGVVVLLLVVVIVLRKRVMNRIKLNKRQARPRGTSETTLYTNAVSAHISPYKDSNEDASASSSSARMGSTLALRTTLMAQLSKLGSSAQRLRRGISGVTASSRGGPASTGKRENTPVVGPTTMAEVRDAAKRKARIEERHMASVHGLGQTQPTAGQRSGNAGSLMTAAL